MVSFNCFPQFVPKIMLGSKRHTFRMKPKCKPGDTMHFYQGLRTKKCTFVAEVICTHVVECTIDTHRVLTPPYLYTLAQSETLFRPMQMWPERLPAAMRFLPLEHFARADGFYNHAEMLEFFLSIYPGFPLQGYLHVWNPIINPLAKPTQRPSAKSTSTAGRAAIKKRKKS